ncbi:TIGR02452 family protein [Dubosiella newyorkensis]|uniref:TIGR02452 family protein n=1 Tax=Dubosiella newyorkensis TaxID=1862672 RepID=UPI0023F1D063|nr:TIGR02452 family protein [Dubosiella newyorkensis]
MRKTREEYKAIAEDTQKKSLLYDIPLTHYFSEEELRILRNRIEESFEPLVEFMDETSTEALVRLRKENPDFKICILNFASAIHAGGGWLSGALAQEEQISRSSNLVRGLKTQPAFYALNRGSVDRYHNCVYRHDLLYSKDVLFFKDDDGKELEKKIKADVITLPAPNLKDVHTIQVLNGDSYSKVIKNRLMGMAAVINEMKPDLVVLGAWGCGAFRNEPRKMGKIFSEIVPYLNVKKVVFSIPKDARNNHQTFKEAYFKISK